jgi:hypothetical protein
MTHERDPLDSGQEPASPQMPGHPLMMPDPHRARPPRPPAAGRPRGGRTGPAQAASVTAGPGEARPRR